jgi:hypothetical protein
VVKHSVGAIVGPLEQRNSSAAWHTDEGGAEDVSRQLVWQQAARVVFRRQRESRSICDLCKFLYNLINRKFLHMQKLIGQNNRGTIDCFGRENIRVLSGL